MMKEESDFTAIRDLHHPSPVARSIFGLRLSAIVEMLVFLTASLFIDMIFGAGTRFAHISPHPYWIILLVITVQYGAGEAVLCALLSSFFLLAWNMPVQTMNQTIYDYILQTMMLPFLWIATATILGGIRTRQLNERSTLQEKLYNSEEQGKTITHAYKRLMLQKENLERRLAEELRSAVTAYRAAKSLETIDERDMHVAAKNITLTTLNPLKFSLYELDKQTLVLRQQYGWDKNDTFSQHFTPGTQLHQAVIQQKRIICMVNAADEPLLTGEGLIAGPIIDSTTHEVFGMLKIEDHGIMGLSMRNIETFRILCEWIGMAYLNTKLYKQALDDAIVHRKSLLPSPKLLQYQESFLTAFAGSIGINLFKVTITLVNSALFSDDQHHAVIHKTSEIIRACLRQTDQLFKAEAKEELALIITCFHAEDIEPFVEKIQLALITQSNELLRKVNFTFHVQSLHLLAQLREAADVKTAS
jgi:polysaccharide biosynthesis protein PelD